MNQISIYITIKLYLAQITFKNRILIYTDPFKNSLLLLYLLSVPKEKKKTLKNLGMIGGVQGFTL